MSCRRSDVGQSLLNNKLDFGLFSFTRIIPTFKGLLTFHTSVIS